MRPVRPHRRAIPRSPSRRVRPLETLSVEVPFGPPRLAPGRPPEAGCLPPVWAKREKQIDRVLTNTVGLHGDVAGIIGGTLPEIAGIELKALAAEVTNAAEDGGEEDASSALTRDP